MDRRPNVALLVLALIAQLLLPSAASQAHATRRDPNTLQELAKQRRLQQPSNQKDAQRARKRGQKTPAKPLRATTVVATARPEPTTAQDRGGVPVVAPISERHPALANQPLRSRRLLQATPLFIGKSLRQTVVTEERPLFDWSTFGFGLEFGVTFSEFHQVRDPSRKGVELVHVSNYDGTSNLESVLARWRLRKKHSRRIELQGPALNTDPAAIVPLGARFIGLGLTDDLIDPNAQEAISYTLEVKVTERTLAELVILGVPLLQKLIPQAGLWSTTTAQAFAATIPFISASVALTTLWRAWKVFRNPVSTRSQRIMVVSHATADVIRVFLPLVGTVLSASLVAIFGTKALIKARQFLKVHTTPATATRPPIARPIHGANEAAASI